MLIEPRIPLDSDVYAQLETYPSGPVPLYFGLFRDGALLKTLLLRHVSQVVRKRIATCMTRLYQLEPVMPLALVLLR
jgi:hypothetical protein